jgi:hypothetical protein
MALHHFPKVVPSRRARALPLSLALVLSFGNRFFSSLQQLADGAPTENNGVHDSLKQMLMEVWANLC